MSLHPHFTARLIVGLLASAAAASASAQITFYEGEGFRGQAFTTTEAVRNFKQVGFNDRASSVVVDSGRWEVCVDSEFRGNCVLLRQGSYTSLKGMGLDDALSSARPSTSQRVGLAEAPDPLPQPDYAWRRRANENVFEAPISNSRAVVGAPTERCWIEREQVRSEPSVGRGVLGAVLGGVIGHQVGGGTGRDIATVGGAVAGAAIGANSGRERSEQDVRRCTTTPSDKVSYWDVTYDFRGVEHHAQMSQQPGRTIRVNAAGEPRQ